MVEHLGHHTALFHDAAAGSQIAVEHREAAIGIQGVVHGVDNFRVHLPAEAGQEVPHRSAGGHPGGQVQIGFDGLHGRPHAAGLIVVVHIELGGGLELGDAGYIPLDLIKGGQVHRDAHHMSQGADMQLGVGGAAGGRHMAQAVLQAALGDDVREAGPLQSQGDDALAHVPGLLILGGGAVQHGGAVDGAQTDDLGENAHGVGGAVHGAGAAGEADILPIAGKGVLVNGVDVALADGLLQVGGDVSTLIGLVGQHTARSEEHGGLVQAGRRHQHTGDDLVAAAQEHHAVEGVGVRHGLDAAGDQVTLRQNVMHSGALRHAVAGGRDVELGGDAAGGPNALLYKLDQFPKSPVTRVHIGVRIGDSDHRLVQILDPVTARVHQTDVVGLLGVAGVTIRLPVLHFFTSTFLPGQLSISRSS